jgi:hypothetical protein
MYILGKYKWGRIIYAIHIHKKALVETKAVMRKSTVHI